MHQFPSQPNATSSLQSPFVTFNVSSARQTLHVTPDLAFRPKSVLAVCSLVLAVLIGLVLAQPASAQITFNGTQTTLTTGLSIDQGVAVDTMGNVYVADTGHNEVKELMAVNGLIPPNPTINVLGSGFNGPKGLAVDAKGDVFVADFYNNAVKQIVAVNGVIPAGNPTINTLGSGFSHPASVAVDSSGDVFVADSNHSQIKEMLAVNGSIPASPTINILGSGFSNPVGVAVDVYGDVYVANELNNLVQEIVAVNGSIPATNPVIENLGSGFSAPSGVAVDKNGNVYVADSNHKEVKEMLATGGQITVVNPVTNILGAGFSEPASIAVDAHGNVYVADAGLDSVVQIDVLSVNFGSVAVGATGPAQTLNFSIAAGTTIGSIGFYAGGIQDHEFSKTSSTTCTATTYSSAAACTVNLQFYPKIPGNRPGAVVFFSALNELGTVLASVPVFGNGTGPQIAYGPGTQIVSYPQTGVGGLAAALGLAVDGAGDVFIADSGNNRVVEVAAGGNTSAIDPKVDGISLSLPGGVALDGAADLFIADEGNSRVVEVPVGGGAASSIEPTVNGEQFSGPLGVAVDGAGDLFVADTRNSRIVEVPAGDGVAFAINPIVNGEGLEVPYSVAVDGAGNLFIADSGNHRVVEVPAGGGNAVAIAPTVNSVAMGSPTAVAVDGLGNLFIADFDNGRVLEVPANNGTPTVIVSPQSASPFALAVDGLGDLFANGGGAIGNQGLLEVQRSQPPTLLFPTATTVGTTDTADGAQTVQILNIGNQPLIVTATNFPTDFSKASGDPQACESEFSLPVREQCDLQIQFAPKTAGALNEVVTLTDNALNVIEAPQNINVSGTGVASAAPATMTSPASGSTLTGSSTTFTWTMGSDVTEYDLHVGTTGAGSSNIFGGTVTGQTKTITGIPITGATLNVRLYSLISGAWQYIDYTYTEASPATRATMSSPTPSSTLTGSTVAFTWTTGSQVTEYDLHIGTTGVGSSNIFAGTVTGTSKSITGIPTTGGTLNVRLYSLIAGAWQYIDYTYTEASPAAPATMSSPTPGSTLTGSSATFTWTTGSQVTQYDLHIGTTGVGSSNTFAGTVTGQSNTVTGSP